MKKKAAPKPTREQSLFDTLKRIASYESSANLRRISDREYGLTADEAIEMAYDNVIHEAKYAIKGMKRPRDAKEQT